MSAAGHSWTRCLTASLACATALICGGSAWAAKSSRDYVQSGLVAHWDGHENAGLFTHHDAAQTWVDLVRGVEVTIPSWVAVEDHSLYVTSGTDHTSIKISAIEGLSSSDAAWTIEVVQQGCGWILTDNYNNLQNAFGTPRGTLGYRQNNTKGFYFFGPSSATKCSLQNWIHSSALVTDLHTMSAKLGSDKATCAIWMDGVADKVDYNANYSADRGTVFSFFGNARMDIRVYAIRVYNRALTQEEITANRAVDVERFVNGEYTYGQPGVYVSGAPENYSVSGLPEYGYISMSDGDERTFSAPTAYTNDAEDVVVKRIGYKIGTYDVGSGIWNYGDLVDSGSYTHKQVGTDMTRLVWQWEVSYKAMAACVGEGSIDKPVQWIKLGESVTMTAVPADGMRFVAWTGDVKSKGSGFTVENVTRPMTFNASFAPIGSPVTYWVATNGNDSAVGGESTPFATLTNALWFAENGDTVKVKAGTYKLPVATSRTVGTTGFSYGTPSFWMTNAVTVVGVEGPEKTIFDGEKKGTCYAFCLNNAKAVLSGVTVMRVNTSIPYQWAESPMIELKNGFVTNCIVRDCGMYYVGGINLRQGAVCGCQVLNVSCSDGLSLGAGINLSHASGTPGITNCIVSGCSGKQGPALYAYNKSPKVYGCVFRNCTANNTGRGGYAAVYVTGGSIENCIITNNQISSGAVTCAGLHFSNAIVRNCLIANNKNKDANGSTGGIYMSGSSAVLECCTVVNNWAKSGTVHGLNQAGGTVRNSIIGFNGPTAGVFGQTGNHVKSGGTVTHSDTYPEMTGDGNKSEDPQFVDASGDYHLSNKSDLFDSGKTQTWMESAKDLDGKPRVSGTSVNIGCYEDETPSVRPFTATGVSDVLSGGNPLTVKFTAMLKNTPDSDNVSYLWTFGDGTTSTEAAPTHVYTSCNKFTVKLDVTSGDTKAPTYTFPAPIEVGPAVVYVNTTGTGTWPYDEPGKGTNDIVEAMASLHAPANGAAKVYCGPGTFTVRSTVFIKNEPVEVIGDGTTFSANLTTGLFVLQHSDAVLRGLTFTYGDWMYGSSSTATYGGFVTLASGTVTNCVFRDAYTQAYCFALVYQSGGLLTDCHFSGCYAWDSGAGGGGRNCFILTAGTVANTVITNCSASSAIGSCEIRGGVVSNCTIVACTGGESGAALQLGTRGANPSGTGILTHSRVIGCKGKSAAPILSYTAGTSLRNVLIAGCSSSGTGTTLAADRGVTENCTIANCTNGNATAAGIVAGANAKVYNTIVWDCYANGEMRNVGGTGTFDHCLTDVDPKFRRPMKGDWRVWQSSPAVNGGALRDWMTSDAIDLQGNPRVLNGAPDIGCYEKSISGFSVFVK